ncbi:hypothetical protein B0H34DRAFT_721252 [Crassisporium funariophilum]|nr:hypothetical protein B0H34DRAFT_721252 [Crassisporium funariophilum]
MRKVSCAEVFMTFITSAMVTMIYVCKFEEALPTSRVDEFALAFTCLPIFFATYISVRPQFHMFMGYSSRNVGPYINRH